jgi:hypothetical protein
MNEQIELWDLWFPDAAAQGLLFARGRLQATEVLLAHAAPANLRVDVVNDAGTLLARGTNLRRTAETPITQLNRRNGRIERVDIWPSEREIGLPVIMAGGEVGILTAWWNDPDRQMWRWSIELFNRK